MNSAEKEYWQHRAVVPQKDDDEDLIFRWHWPRGTFDRRMSALEIAAFLMPHMPHIVPLLEGSPRIQLEFQWMLNRFLFWPKEVLDELSSWVYREPHTEADEIICLNVRSHYRLPSIAFGLPT